MEGPVGAAYIRASTDDQLEYSPDSQLKAVRDCARREGYEIPEEYVFQDDGISGKSASKRPAFRRMIALAKSEAPPFDRIYVWEYSRFARNQEESILYKNLLRKKGVAIRSVREPLIDSPFASLIERIIEWMDEYYLINLAVEVRRGMAEKAARGEAMGAAPFGYRVENKRFVPDENAGTVRYIFSQFAAGRGARDLSRELDGWGIRTRRGNRPDSRWVMYILRNPVYIGKIRWSADGRADYSRGGADDVPLAEGKHEPIVSRALWDAVRDRLALRDTETKYVRREGPRDYPLKGLIRCGDCGATLVLRSCRESPALQCCRYARGQCAVSHHISEGRANEAVRAALERLMPDRGFLFCPRPPDRGRPIHRWDALIAAQERRLERARTALLDGVLTGEEYAAARKAAQEAIDGLRAGRDAQLARDAEAVPAVCEERSMDVLALLRSPTLPPRVKNEALRAVLDRVVFRKPENRLELYFAEQRP